MFIRNGTKHSPDAFPPTDMRILQPYEIVTAAVLVASEDQSGGAQQGNMSQLVFRCPSSQSLVVIPFLLCTLPWNTLL